MTSLLQLSSGVGPSECCWVVEHLLRSLQKEAKALGLTAEVVDTTPNDKGPGLRSAIIALSGSDAQKRAHKWCGSIQWIGQSPLRPNHRRKNWFVRVDILHENEIMQSALSLGEVRFESFKATGPGGQHMNKTETAVRAVHHPTGLQVTARSERSQHLNRRLALTKLAALLEKQNQERHQQIHTQRWTHHHQLERGNPKRVYRGESFKRVR